MTRSKGQHVRNTLREDKYRKIGYVRSLSLIVIFRFYATYYEAEVIKPLVTQEIKFFYIHAVHSRTRHLSKIFLFFLHYILLHIIFI